MNRVKLLTVEERFQLSGIGLTLAPDFPVPTGKWKNIQCKASIVCPSGDQFEAVAQLNMTHFNISDPSAPIERRWRVLVTLPDVPKEKVPVGSSLLVEQEVLNAVLYGSDA